MVNSRAGVVYSWLAADARRSNESISNAVLCRTACQHLAVDGVSVTLMAAPEEPAEPDRAARPPPRQEPLATSGDTSAQLEELHLTSGEGPSTEAFVRTAPVLVPDLHEAARRWPGFAPAALAHDVAAVFAFPLHTAAFPLQSASVSPGVLTAYRARPGALPRQALTDLDILTGLATRLLPTEPARPATAETRPAAGPGAERDQVHQAVGMLAVQLGVSLAEAFTRLRAHAMSHDLSLTELARQVIIREVRLPADT